jgi:hypothetical protein
MLKMVTYRGHFLPLNELNDLWLLYNENRRQDTVTMREYARLYPERICPGRVFIRNLDVRVRETGSFLPRIEGRGRNVRTIFEIKSPYLDLKLDF